MNIADLDIRDAFFDELYAIAAADPQVIFLTADMGAFSLERFKRDLPGQYFNVGVAEQNMISVAAGLALSGKKVFVYSIVPFATLRCFEQIKIDLCCMNLGVVIVGIGAGVMYGGDGPTHHATSDIAVMRSLPEMTIFNPADAGVTRACARMSYRHKGPAYVRIEKGKLPLIYKPEEDDFSEGLGLVASGKDVLILSTGIMTHAALQATATLRAEGLDAGVVDIYRLKPLNIDELLEYIGPAKALVTLEENSLVAGLGSAVSELLTDRGLNIPLLRLALPDEHCFSACSREAIHGLYNLDPDGVAGRVRAWVLSRRGNH